MNILIVSEVDCSGSAWALYMALVHSGNNVVQVVFRKNKLNYPCDIFRPSTIRMKELCDWADVINLHTGPKDVTNHIAQVFWKKPVIITYHGSTYRERHRQYNLLHRDRGWFQTAMTLDLCQYGPKWLPRSQQDLSLMEHANITGFKVIHCPTQPVRKGTAFIKEALRDIPYVEFEVVTGVSNMECLRRKAQAHVLVDRLGVNQLGYGTNALEAWSLGIPVLGDAHPELYQFMKKKLGVVPFIQVDSVRALRANVEELRDNIELRQKWTAIGRTYIATHHAPKVVVERFLEYCGELL